MINSKFFSKNSIKAKNRADTLIMLSFISLTWVITAILSPTFFEVDNIRNIFIQAAPLGFVVIGQMFVIISRGLDLSVASIMATTAVIAISVESDWVIVIFMTGCLLGVLVGLFNGYLVAKRGMAPFLVTLAVMIILQGVRFSYTGGSPTGDLSDTLRFIATGSVFGVPISVVVLILVAILAHYILEYTIYGRHLSLYGENPLSAEVCGYNKTFLLIGAYVISALLASIGGLFLVGYVGIVDNWTGQGFEIDSIAAAVMGGVALKGGKGSVLGALLGALLLISLFNIIVILGLSVEFQMVLKGALIILAVSIYSIRRSNV